MADPSVELSLRGPSRLSACSISVLPRLDNQRLDSKHAALVSSAVSSAVGIAVTGVTRPARVAIKRSSRRFRKESEVVAFKAGPIRVEAPRALEKRIMTFKNISWLRYAFCSVHKVVHLVLSYVNYSMVFKRVICTA